MQNVYFPAKWKCASACAISKTLHVPEFDQIYPISMTFVLAGVFESFLADCLMVDFKPHFDPAQYGSMKGSSINHYLVHMLDVIHGNFDQ